jgi:hypothetical protein
VEFGGDGGFEGEGLLGEGVIEGEFPGVEHEARGLDFLFRRVAVDGVAEDGTGEAVFHVDADLMGASGEEAALDEGAVFVDGEAFPLGDGFFAGAVVEDGHALAVDGVAADEVLLAAFVFGWDAVDDGEVGFGDATVGEGFGEAAVGAVVLGDDDAAGGVFVEAMDDAGAGFTADAGEVVAVMEEGVDEGAVGVAGGGVDDEAGGFVDDEDVAVLIEDFDGDVLGDDFDGGGVGDGEGDEVAGANDGAGLGGFGVETAVVGFDEVLEAGAGVPGEAGVEEAVEAFSSVLGLVSGELEIGHGG